MGGNGGKGENGRVEVGGHGGGHASTRDTGYFSGPSPTPPCPPFIIPLPPCLSPASRPSLFALASTTAICERSLLYWQRQCAKERMQRPSQQPQSQTDRLGEREEGGGGYAQWGFGSSVLTAMCNNSRGGGRWCQKRHMAEIRGSTNQGHNKCHAFVFMEGRMTLVLLHEGRRGEGEGEGGEGGGRKNVCGRTRVFAKKKKKKKKRRRKRIVGVKRKEGAEQGGAGWERPPTPPFSSLTLPSPTPYPALCEMALV